jgi:spore germination protein
MIIHVVQPGDTIHSIAEIYNVSVQRLIEDNGIQNPDNLVIGQTIVIIFPKDIYVVKEGDTLSEIAKVNEISLMQLLRNNPYLAGRDFIYPGESLLIHSKDNKIKKIMITGFASPYIDRTVLKQTLPYLTYLSIYGYEIEPNGDLIDLDDSEIIKIAKDYGVAPIMFLTPLNPQGDSFVDVTNNILYNSNLLDYHINAILKTLKLKGYYGVNVTFQFINTENTDIYENFLSKLVNILGSEGYPVFVTLIPRTKYNINEITFEKINYTFVGDLSNSVMLLTYNWGYSYGPPAAVTSVLAMKDFLNFVTTLIPREKIDVGISVIGYNWPLPYIIGLSKAYSLTNDAAVFIALDNNAIIQFDTVSQSPFFNFDDTSYGYPKEHIVWFVDARTINAMLELIPQYGLDGFGAWNIMQFFTQMWVIINTKYEIIKILENKIDE